MKDNSILYGMEQIRPVVGNATEVTILKWYREYATFPMRKLGGQWVSHREELNAWWRAFVLGDVLPANPDKNLGDPAATAGKSPRKKRAKKTMSSKK